jgi:hypothetical protein
MRNLTVCRFHGGSSPGALAKAAREAATTDATAMATAAGVDVPQTLKPRDFGPVVAEYVSRFNRVFARLESELDGLRAAGNEIDLSREYADVLDRQATTATLVTKMMQAAAALGIKDDPRPDETPSAKIREALEGIAFRRRAATAGGCPTCGAAPGAGGSVVVAESATSDAEEHATVVGEVVPFSSAEEIAAAKRDLL